MSEVPSSLTELKIQIGKGIYDHALEAEFAADDAYCNTPDQASDQFYAKAADSWRTAHPDVAKTFAEGADKALLGLSEGRGSAVATLLAEMIAYVSDMVNTGPDMKAFYASAMLNGVLAVDSTNAQPYYEALVAHGRGE